MILIKRYPNRKLYDTEAKQYITLEGIEGLIRQGHDVQVLDHASGEDLTSVTLTQIIFEMEKKESGFLPHSFLAGLIQAGGSSLGSLQKKLLSSVNYLHLVDEEIQRRIQELQKLGEITEREAQQLLDKLVNWQHKPPEEVHTSIEYLETKVSLVEDHLIKRHLPTRSEVQNLYQQLSTLEAKLDQLTTNAPNEK